MGIGRPSAEKRGGGTLGLVAKRPVDPLDFLDVDALLSDEERDVRDTVRKFVRDRKSVV